MEDLKELRRLAEIVASHEPDFKDIHEYLEALRNMQGELSGTTVLSLLNRLEQAEQALDATERQVVARSGETAAERIWRVRAEQAEQAVARVEKLLKDSEEVESVFASQHDRIWIDCVRRAVVGDGRG